ncbi:hypothetical protein ACH5RR_021264 [Cinchona calisaya]|uniref:Uncharacterized protein n=1 Tax=Cinchona calisaya TaxID=153742 RepID=A0ABD2ZGT6_9GENT
MMALSRDMAYVKRLTPQQKLDELHVSLMNAVTILPTLAEREASFNSVFNSAELAEVRDKVRLSKMEKKTLEVDVGDQDKKVADLEQKVLQLQEEALMSEAKFVSREVELRINSRNQFVASTEADEMFKEFTKKVFSMGFTLACDHLVKNPDLYEGLSYDASVTKEVINGLQAQFKAPASVPGTFGATLLIQGPNQASTSTFEPSTSGAQADVTLL